MEDIFKILNLPDDNEIFRGYTTITELCNALKIHNKVFFIQKIRVLEFNLGVAFLMSVSID